MRSASTRVDRGDATRRALFAAARSSFGTRGYAATSLQSIVEDADVTKGAFYHHFDGKQQIFTEVFEEVHREIGRRAFVVHLDTEGSESDMPRVRDLASEPNSQVFQHLIGGCRTYLEAHTQPEVQRIVLLDGRAVLPWEEWHRIHSEHGVVLLRADLRRAIRRRILRPLPLNLLATMLAGALNEACIAITNADDPDEVIAEAMSVIAEILEGLRFPPGSD
jgi:AcrR family transcriptional regulator